MPNEAAMAVVPQGTRAVVVSTEWESQKELILRTVAPGLNEDEFRLFLHVAHVRKLDPLQRQIHAVKRSSWSAEKQGYEDKMTIQTGIDGYRAIANRTGDYMPSDIQPLVEGQGTEDLRVTVWVKKYHEKSREWHQFSATAYYREFVQLRKDKGTGKWVPNSMWEKMPINQLTKCAEALAIRKGWPEETGGIYVDEEMQHNDPTDVLPPSMQEKKHTAERAMGQMKPSTEPNRGHGNEGTQRTQQAQQEPVICAECRATNGHTKDCSQNPDTKKKGKQREQWAKKEGHDPKIHISFDEFLQMTALQGELNVSDETFKAWLDDNFEIEHRWMIPQSIFQKILDAMRDMFDPKAKKAQADNAAAPEGMPDGKTLFGNE